MLVPFPFPIFRGPISNPKLNKTGFLLEKQKWLTQILNDLPRLAGYAGHTVSIQGFDV
tara:strand:- start:20013 stop:20186 length:174 start_codon:yes stop_codon:yes gene_type:complete